MSRDKEIQLLADSGVLLCVMLCCVNISCCDTAFCAAVKMCEVQTEVVCVEDELGTRRQQVAHLQAKLHEAEKILVSFTTCPHSLSLSSPPFLDGSHLDCSSQSQRIILSNHTYYIYSQGVGSH